MSKRCLYDSDPATAADCSMKKNTQKNGKIFFVSNQIIFIYRSFQLGHTYPILRHDSLLVLASHLPQSQSRVTEEIIDVDHESLATCIVECVKRFKDDVAQDCFPIIESGLKELFIQNLGL